METGIADIVFGHYDSGVFFICFNYNIDNETQIFREIERFANQE